MRIVFDTNVLVSAFITRGSSFEVFEHCLFSHESFASRHIMREVEAVLRRKLSFPNPEIALVMEYLEEHLVLVEADQLERPVCRDPSDDLVLACALSARADCLLTGDEDLLVLEAFEGTAIVRPADFWKFEKHQLT